MRCVKAMRAPWAALGGTSTRLIVSCSCDHFRLVFVANESEYSGNQHGRTCPREPAGAEGSEQVEELIQYRE